MSSTLRISAALSLLLCFGCHNPFVRRQQGSITPCKSNVRNLATALEMYASDNGGRYPTTWTKLTSGNYLKLIPTCPAAGTDTYSSTYRYTTASRAPNGKRIQGKDTFSFHCQGNNHSKNGTRPNHPAYDSEFGLEEK